MGFFGHGKVSVSLERTLQCLGRPYQPQMPIVFFCLQSSALIHGCNRYVAMSMDSTTISCACLSMVATHLKANYLFLSDYVNCGKQSVEYICLLSAYKIKYPENFFILHRNHKCASINQIYSFYNECKHRYSVKAIMTSCDPATFCDHI